MGFPSHIFPSVFQLNPQQFQQCFLNWIKSINKQDWGEVVAIDGKSYVILMIKGRAGSNSWWVLNTENRLVLGKLKWIKIKWNTAIPELLKVIELSGCIVTIDAIGCQKEIIKLINEKDADYIIA